MGDFGTAVITLTHYDKTGTPDELGGYTLTPVTVEAPGCRHRPLNFTEAAELGFDIATLPWKSTIPIYLYDDATIAALLALLPQDVIVVDGQEYQIVGGVRPFDDLEGRPFKATIVSQKQIG